MKQLGVHLSVCLSHHRTPLLSAERAGDIDRQRRSAERPCSSSGAAARRTTANASSVALLADVGS